MNEPVEFPVPPDRTAYFVPSIGVGMLAFMGAALVSMVLAMAMPDPPGVDEIMAIDAGIGVLAAAWWIRRWYRINHERRLVLDREGIVYVRFAGRRRVMRWEEIERVTERVDVTTDGDTNVLDLELRRGRFSIRDFDFAGYWQLRELIRQRLPSKTTLLKKSGSESH